MKADLYYDREISTLSFNDRVLQEAEDLRNPLMERLRFLGIFSSNMDEFYKVRVATLHRQIELGEADKLEVLEMVGRKTRELDARFRFGYNGITKELGNRGVRLLNEEDVAGEPEPVRDWLRDYFQDTVLPTLVPIIVDERKTFPPLVDGGLYFAVKMDGEVPRYAILQIPDKLPRFVVLPNGNIMYLDDVIRLYLHEVFYIFEFDAIEAHEFKISRDAELDMDNDFSEDYIRRMEIELKQRKGGRPTRLVYDASMSPVMLKILIQELAMREDDPRIGGGRYHNMKDLMMFPNRLEDTVFQKLEPADHFVLDTGRRPMVETILAADVLVTYPYQSFDHVIRVLREAAIDPEVTAINMTLYRVADNSQVVNALMNAAWNGKDVFVCIEVQARFDEKRNIKISELLTEAGATVVYGIPPMKVHSKLLLIERQGKMVCGLSTGNFNESTARQYVDSILFTSDTRIAKEVRRCFEFLEHASRNRVLKPPRFKHLLVAPINFRQTIKKLIDREREKGEAGYIFLKVNHLTDPGVRQWIRKAAAAGVEVDLVVRTTYTMKPHKNIRAVSIVDRFLEHQRVYIFGRSEDQKVYLSSADLMERNLDWRMEVAFPIYDARARMEVKHLMTLQRNDTYKARILDENQSNAYVPDDNGGHHCQRESYLYLLAGGQDVAASAIKDVI